jgi:hypothetical protein
MLNKQELKESIRSQLLDSIAALADDYGAAVKRNNKSNIFYFETYFGKISFRIPVDDA